MINLFRLKKENRLIKDRIIRDIRNLFQHEEEGSYKSVKVGCFWSNNYIEYESNGDRSKILSTEEYLNKIRPYLKNIRNNLKKSDSCKIQLTPAINFMSSQDHGEERVIHSKSDKTEIKINDKEYEVIEELIFIYVFLDIRLGQIK